VLVTYLVLSDVVNPTERELYVKPELRFDRTTLLVEVGTVEVVDVEVVEVIFFKDVEVVEVIVVEIVDVEELVVGIPCTRQPPVTEGTALTPVEIGIIFAVTDPVQVVA
jgi:hypothetical protein